MKNQLSIIVKESGLEKTKAQVLLDNFSDYFQVAAEWEKKAKAIVVSDATQEADMKMARVGRLFLREKRIAIEHTRKELKEQSLREGKAIDGIANVLKALIVPIEEYLEKQERYVEIKAIEEAKHKQIEEEKKAEEERIAKEKAEAEERIRVRKENERLKKEAEERERKMAEERAKAEKERAEAEKKRCAYEEKVKREKEATERAVREARERQERIIEQQKAKAIAERKEKEDAERRVRVEREKAEAEKAAYKANMIKCPFCHKSFNLGQAEKGEQP